MTTPDPITEAARRAVGVRIAADVAMETATYERDLVDAALTAARPLIEARALRRAAVVIGSNLLHPMPPAHQLDGMADTIEKGDQP